METLSQLVSRISGDYLPKAVRNRSFFINEVPSDLAVDHNREWIASVVSGMLSTVVMHARDTCIRLSGRKYGQVIVLEVQESGCISTYAMACGLQDVQTMAEKIGGSLNISVHKSAVTRIAFSFPNLPIAA